MLVEIYPREGTETRMIICLQQIKKLKFIPVRGRKLFPALHVVSYAVEIYPREGTETGAKRRLIMQLTELKFIPVRGRKRECMAEWTIDERVEIYPREGTETG